MMWVQDFIRDSIKYIRQYKLKFINHKGNEMMANLMWKV